MEPNGSNWYAVIDPGEFNASLIAYSALAADRTRELRTVPPQADLRLIGRPSFDPRCCAQTTRSSSIGRGACRRPPCSFTESERRATPSEPSMDTQKLRHAHLGGRARGLVLPRVTPGHLRWDLAAPSVGGHRHVMRERAPALRATSERRALSLRAGCQARVHVCEGLESMLRVHAEVGRPWRGVPYTTACAESREESSYDVDKR